MAAPGNVEHPHLRPTAEAGEVRLISPVEWPVVIAVSRRRWDAGAGLVPVVRQSRPVERPELHRQPDAPERLRQPIAEAGVVKA